MWEGPWKSKAHLTYCYTKSDEKVSMWAHQHNWCMLSSALDVSQLLQGTAVEAPTAAVRSERALRHGCGHVCPLSGQLIQQPASCRAPHDCVHDCCALPAEWEEELVRYSAKHPSMRIIDSMDAIRPIMSRLSMLAPFGDHGIHLKAWSPHSTCLT